MMSWIIMPPFLQLQGDQCVKHYTILGDCCAPRRHSTIQSNIRQCLYATFHLPVLVILEERKRGQRMLHYISILLCQAPINQIVTINRSKGSRCYNPCCRSGYFREGDIFVTFRNRHLTANSTACENTCDMCMPVEDS